MEDITQSVQKLSLASDVCPPFETTLASTAQQQSRSETLDSLLIQKLIMIDKYNLAREHIGAEFRDGFINLSRANYANSKGISGGRYGKDQWDGRVQATLRVQVDEEGGLRIGQRYEKEGAEESVKRSEKEGIRNRKCGAVGNEEGEDEEKEKRKKKKEYDPINMFGVLVPYQLKESQSNFQRAIEDLIELTRIVKDLEQIDKNIIKLQNDDRSTL